MTVAFAKIGAGAGGGVAGTGGAAGVGSGEMTVAFARLGAGGGGGVAGIGGGGGTGRVVGGGGGGGPTGGAGTASAGAATRGKALVAFNEKSAAGALSGSPEFSSSPARLRVVGVATNLKASWFSDPARLRIRSSNPSVADAPSPQAALK